MGGTGLEPVTPSLSSAPWVWTRSVERRQTAGFSAIRRSANDSVGLVWTQDADTFADTASSPPRDYSRRHGRRDTCPMPIARIRLVVVAAVAVLAAAAALAFGGGSASYPPSFTPPAWLKASEQRALKQLFHAPKPLRVYYIAYPRKIAVILAFPKPVECWGCPGEPGGTTIVRTSASRTPPHGMGGEINFCLALAACLRR
jgi:hypothetical protein